jgi:uncharacterized membrane protein
MSFILDALKKLEREKEAHDPGVVMVGPVPWGERDRGRRGPRLALAGAVLAITLTGVFLWLRAEDSPATAPLPAATGAAPPLPAEVALPSASEAPDVAAVSGEATALEADATPPPSRRPPWPGAAPLAAEEAPVAAAPEAPDLGEVASAEAPVERIEPATGSSSVPGFHLTAISSRDGHPIALLNDRLVREGDRFDGITVIRIDEASVEIEIDGRRRTIGF